MRWAGRMIEEVVDAGNVRNAGEGNGKVEGEGKEERRGRRCEDVIVVPAIVARIKAGKMERRKEEGNKAVPGMD